MRNPDVDAYIRKAAPFARPILRKIRAIFHRAAPGLEEKLKWGCPSFERNGRVGGMAAFKSHTRLLLWHAELLRRPLAPAAKIVEVRRLPPEKALAAYVRAAVARNLAGVKIRRPPQPPLRLPADFRKALGTSKKARAGFDALSPSARRDYARWVTGAKTPETRARRLATAVEWLARGKPRNRKHV